PVQVRARFEPIERVSQVSLEYFIDDVAATGEATTTVALRDDGAPGIDPAADDDEWSVVLPALPDNTLVRYRIKGDRGAGVEVISPRPSDPRAWHAYFVTPVVNTQTRLYHVLIAPANWTQMWNNIQGGRVSNCAPRASWDATVPAVFVHEGRVHDVFARYQGSRYNRSNGPQIASWPYPGPSAPSPLRALSWRFSLPRYAQLEGRSDLTLNKLTQGCPGLDAGVGYQLYAAVGVPAPTTRYARLHVNGGYYHYMIEYERPGEEMMRRWHREREAADPTLPREKVGHLHKSAGCNCDEGPYGWGDERTLFASCGHAALVRYQYTYDRKTHGWDGYENIQSVIEEMNGLRGDDEAMRVFFEERFDLELLLNYLAIMNWSVPFDDMFQNHFLYQRLSDGKWIPTPWDLDLNFGGWKGASASIYMGEQGNLDNRSGWWNYMKDSFLKAYRPEFETRLLELTNTVLHPDEIDRLVGEVLAQANPAEAAQAPAGVACSFTTDAATMRNFAVQRHQVVNSLLASVIVNAGADQTVVAGTMVQFDARASRPDPGPGAVYSWSNGMSGDYPTHRFDDPGVFNLTLTLTVAAAPYTDSVTITVLAPPSEAYAEQNGMVVVEAEHFYSNDRHGAAGTEWAAASSAAGYSGTGYMIAAQPGARVTFTSGFAATSPELRYAVLFSQAGDY
ncbi:MAG: CotH kinase family protein, partial [Thermoanaerobaculia bacterium]